MTASDMEFQFNPTNGYAVVVVGLLLLVLLYLSTRFVCQWITSLAYHATLKYLVYSNMSWLNFLERRPSVKDTVFTIVYISANGVCIGWNTKSSRELSHRCATLLATNILVLLPGAGIAADILHIPLRSYQFLHAVIGLVALAEGSIHATVELSTQNWDGGTMKVTGLAVSATCIITIPLYDYAKPSKSALRGISNGAFRMLHVHMHFTLATHIERG
jgi:hypothetical protein